MTTTVRDYDLAETTKLVCDSSSFMIFHVHRFQVRGAYMGIAMMAFLHLYMKFTQPLFIQALMGIKGLYDAKPVHIHILGKPAEGDLKRPFKTGGGLFGGTCIACPLSLGTTADPQLFSRG